MDGWTWDDRWQVYRRDRYIIARTDDGRWGLYLGGNRLYVADYPQTCVGCVEHALKSA